MSLYRLFQSTIARLKRRTWGASITDKDGKAQDTGVDDFARELYDALSSDAPIELRGPLRFTRGYSGPAFLVSGTDAAVGYVDEAGVTTGNNPASIRVRVTEIGDETLRVQSTTGDPFYVAKPYELRRSSFDKKTINSVTYTYSGPQTRDASGTVQGITPPYAVGDEIVIVAVQNGFEVIGPGGDVLVYTDSNFGSKTWQVEDSPANPDDSTRWKIVPTDLYTATVATLPVTNATSTTPIVMTVVNHGLKTGEHAIIQNVAGNTAANGTWEVDSKTNRVTNATNATPIVITTAARHGYANGEAVHVEGVRGNTAANNGNFISSWTISLIDDFSFRLVDSIGNATFDEDCNARCWSANTFTIHELKPRTLAVTGATNASPIALTVIGHGLQNNSYVVVLGVLGNTAANNSSANDVWQITLTGANTFTLNGSTGNGAYVTSNGTVTPAFENFLEPVASNGAYTANTGKMLVPGRVSITAQTFSQAVTNGFQLGYGLRMRSSAGTTYGVITALPGTTGFPYEGRPPNMPLNAAGVLSFAGAPLLSDLTELAVSDTSLVVPMTLNANRFPHFGADSQLPITQLVQGSPAGLVAKWRGFGGGTIFGKYGKSYAHWYGSRAYLVMWAAVQQRAANTERDPKGLFSGGTVTVIADRDRPYNSVGVHTDGSALFGSLVTRSSNFNAGHPVTGLKGWTFRKMDAAGTTIQETSTVLDGGTGTDLRVAITGASAGTPISITVLDHRLSDGMKITIASVGGNTNANGTWYVDKTGVDTFTLYSDSALTVPVSAGPGAYTSGGYYTHGLASTQCVLESLTMTAAAGSKHEIEDLANGPFVNVDIGGQLVSRASSQRGVRTSRVASQLIYNPPTEINLESYDVIFNSRIEIACLSLGNRPGAREDAAADPSAAQFLTVFLVFVVE